MKTASEVCPCCGHLSAKQKCATCSWQNDGHDNPTAYQYSARNKTNLNFARYRYLTSAQPTASERIFRLDESGGFIEEYNSKGKKIYSGPIPFVTYDDLGGHQVAAIPIRLKR